ncbi:uncharacterized protein LOC123009128, partial [Tribolium madens]|uniref:uncharacterized protein LOC123009128 n=1 Tax=Tribolium madens TaxID=41895 RepID=UPI001CF75C9E
NRNLFLGFHKKKLINFEGASNGHIIVIDMKELVFGHITKLGPLVIKKFLYYLQEAKPLILKTNYLRENCAFFDWEDKQTVDESKRPEKPKHLCKK